VKPFLDLLPDGVADWMVRHAGERRFAEGDVLIREGEVPAAIFMLLEGVLDANSADGRRLARLGPGSLVGEMSFADEAPASASVVAAEAALALVLPRDLLAAQLASDPAFAAGFYRALAATVSGRLRAANARLGAAAPGEEPPAAAPADAAVQRAIEALDGWKALLLRLDRDALKQGEVSEEGYREFAALALELMHASHVLLGASSPLHDALRAQFGARMQREILPYVLATETAERFYAKPRGYAGDYLAIDMIYRNEPRGTGRIGPVVDRLFLDTPPARAVRHRRALLAAEIVATVRAKAPGPARVACLASGPAREVFDAFAALDDKRALSATLLDIDLQALAHVEQERARQRLAAQVTLVNENLIALFLGRGRTVLEPQDLIYSIGVTDYLPDRLLVKLLDFCARSLAPGGRVIVGNFHPRNTAREFMDHVLEWNLIHRTEEDMNRLFEASDFRRPCTRIRFEPEGIDLFAECVKEV
jgi:CRP-like cAMP-binding protein/SAM-dependent methyltransferase